MIIDIIYIRRAIIKTKNNAPVCSNSHGPKAFHLAFQSMQSQPGLVHVGNRRGGMECRQNIAQLVGMFRIYTPWVVLFKKPLESLVADCFYHPEP